MIADAKDHHIFKLSEMDQTQKETFIRMAMVTAKCVKHNLFPSRYCLTKSCMKLVCPECCLDYHKDHDLQSLSECASLSREKLKEISEKAQRMEVDTKIEIDRLNQSISDKSAEKKSFGVQVATLFDAFREKLERYEQTLLASGNEMYDTKISKLESNRTETIRIMTNMEEIIQNVKVAQKIGTNAFLVSEQHHLECWLEDVESHKDYLYSSEDDVQIELIKESVLDKVYQGQIYHIQERKIAKQGKEEIDVYEYETSQSELGKDESENVGSDLHDDIERYLNSNFDGRGAERAVSVLSLPLPAPPLPFKKHLSHPNLKFQDREHLSNNPYYNSEYPTRLTFERKVHINASSMVSGLTVTRNNEIVAVHENEKRVSIIEYDQESGSTAVHYNVKRNWIQPWDASALYDDRRNKTTIYVTDSDDNQGYIVSFEIKRKEVVKTKTLISSPRLQPKGIATRQSDIFICDSEQGCVIVYNTNGQFKQRIGLYNTLTHPLYISRVLDETLVISDDVRGSIVRIKTNGEFESETLLGSNSVSQVDIDIQGTIFVGDFKSPVLYALIDHQKYNVNGHFEGILQTTAICVDNRNRIIVGHSKGIEVLRVNYIYGDQTY